MTLVITAGDTTYTTDLGSAVSIGGLDWNTLEIEDIFAPTGDTASVSGVFYFPHDIPRRLPEVDQAISITFTPDSSVYPSPTATTLFGGVIEAIDAQIIGRNEVYVTLKCRDYVKWLDRRLVSGTFTDANAGTMIKTILSQFSSGFTTADVEDVATILPKSFNFVPMSEAFQDIANAANANWWVDFDRKVYFKPAFSTGNTAPMSLYNVDSATEVGGLKFTISTEGIQNALVIKDFFFRSPNLVYKPANATQNGFSTTTADLVVTDDMFRQKRTTLDYPPYDLTDFTFETRPTGGGAWTSKTPQWDLSASTPGADDMNTNFVYVNFATRTVRWSFATISTDEVRISYRPMLKNFFAEQSRDPLSIEEFSRRESLGGRTSDGVYERLIDFKDLEFGGIDPIQSLLGYSGIVLANHAWPMVDGEFETTANYWITTVDTTTGAITISSSLRPWKAGQTFHILSEAFNIFDYQDWVKRGRPTGEVEDFGLGPLIAEGSTGTSSFESYKTPLKCWVKSVHIKPLGPHNLHYKIGFSNRQKDI